MSARIYFVLLLLSLFGLTPIVCQAQTPATAQKHNALAQIHRDKALSLAHKGDLNGAIQEYQSAFELDKVSYLDDAAVDAESMGVCSTALNQFDKSIAYYQQALSLYQKVKDTVGEVSALDDIGDTYISLKQDDKAVASYQQALSLFQQMKEVDEQVQTLHNLGNAYLNLHQYDKAFDAFQQALPLYQQLKDTKGEGQILNYLGIASENLSQYDKAIGYYQQALSLFQQDKDTADVAKTLNNLGNTYVDLSQYEKAIQYFQQALPIFQQNQDQDAEASVLNNLGNGYIALSQYAKASQDDQQALTIYQQTHNREGQANALNNLGNVALHQSQYDKAIDYYQQALLLYQEVKIHGAEAKTLNNLGNVYTDLSQYDKAIDYLQQALALYQQVKDRQGQADSLLNLGNAYRHLSQYAKAIQCYQQVLPIYQEIKDRHGEARLLTNQGNAYFGLNEYDKANDAYTKALPIYVEVKDKDGQATDLMDLGNAAHAILQNDKAVGYYQQAVPIYQEIKDRNGEARAIGNLAVAYINLKQLDKARAAFNQAFLLYEQVKDIHGEGNLLSSLGIAYIDLNQYEKASGDFQQALSIDEQVKDRKGEADNLTGLMIAWLYQDNPRLAIFYGKQAINIYQSIRQDNQGLDKDTQETYLKDKESAYRVLAELLIQQGRLPEAEQILNLLKDQEFFDFVQRDAAYAPAAGQASLAPVESDWQARYQVISDKITAIGLAKQDLLTKQQQADSGQITLTAIEKSALTKDLAQADADLTVANKAFQDFLTQIAKEAETSPKSTQDRVQTVTDATAFEDTLSQLGPGTVALYTIVEPDKVRIVMVTSQTQVAREYAIKDMDLRAKVLAFRQILQDPTRDPRPLAHELYQILVGPIEKDLQGAKATTLMWSLDDVLRYIPMAALYDGKQYLVERYKNDVFTPASESRLTETPKAAWNGLGLGVSLAHPGFLALTGVPQELDGVIHDPAVTASQTGALPGTILLDTAFTQQAMTQELETRKYPLVHIASHFDFQPGDEAASFLLLGDGKHLTLADIKTLPQVFQGVDLLTLSACDTADGSAGTDGKEVEGFAVLAQRLGAKAVIASLWPVADASTPVLMETLYKQHAAVPGLPKAEALRQAQISLLHGTGTGGNSAASRAKIIPDKKNPSIVDAPPFTLDPKAPFAHPYYWAPFILIGNWK